MLPLTRSDLMSLEEYAAQRAGFRSKVLTHKKNRQVAVGSNATLYFEDRLTIQYQIQEMLRIERIFEPQAIEEELTAYNPLIPDGNNWKATFMLEFTDVDQRRAALASMTNIEDKVWVQIKDQEQVYAVADEDLERGNEEKTSAVHFLRFELSPKMIEALRNGNGSSGITIGIAHPTYNKQIELNEATRTALIQDLIT
ncbi:hypothetical protein TI03_01530 [Achromatium sp. WMS1]|nr:hypothetical protein TI03_01530 [Achromatium sp. WMS1]